MLPDMSASRCTHLLITGAIAKGLNSNVVRQLTGEGLSERRRPVAEEEYVIGGSSQNARIFMAKQGRSTFLVVHVDRFDNMDSHEESSQVTNLLESLNSLNLQTRFDFDFLFTLGARAARGIFPVRLPVFANLEMDEIRAFKGVKFHPGPRKAIKYQLSVETPDLKELYVNVEFTRNQVFHSDMIHQTLREAAGVVRDIIPESEWGD